MVTGSPQSNAAFHFAIWEVPAFENLPSLALPAFLPLHYSVGHPSLGLVPCSSSLMHFLSLSALPLSPLSVPDASHTSPRLCHVVPLPGFNLCILP